MSDRSRLSIDIGRSTIDKWSGYSLQSDMLIPSDVFTCSIPLLGTLEERRAILALVDRGVTEITAHIHMSDEPDAPRVLQYTGLLDARKAGGDKHSGTSLSISANDRAVHLVRSSCDLTAIRNVGTNFLRLVEDLVRPWGIQVVADGTASRDIATGLALALPPGVNRTTREAMSQGLPAGSDPSRATVTTDDEAALDQERAAAAGRRRALAQVRTLGAAAIAGDGVATAAEQRAVVQAANRADALRSSAQRAASVSVASNGQSAVAIRTIALNEARPQAGEMIWNFILRQAKRFGLVPWFSPDGKLIISSPNYGGPVVHKLVRRIVSDPREPNNVISGVQSYQPGEMVSSVTVYGRGLGNDVARATIVGRVENPDCPFERPLVIHDLTIRDRDEAQRRAQREMMRATHGLRTLDYVVPYHGNARALYATDTVIEVLDESIDVAGEFYVVARTFSYNREAGSTTELKLVEKGSILL
jgi:prophage tail gpP-like protein